MASTKVAREEKYWGAEVATLENEHLRVKVVPEKGSDVVEIVYKRKGFNLLYESPIGFKRFGSISPPVGTEDSGFMDYYEGGWQDIVPSPGLASSNRGASWGLHGESSLMPWHAAVAEEGECARLRVSTSLVRYPFHVDKTLSLAEGSSVLKVDETVTNLAEQDVEFAWLQHIVFQPPMVAKGMQIDLRAGTCTAGVYKQARLRPAVPFEWPNAPGLDGSTIDMSREPPEKRCEDNIYATLKEPWYAVRNPNAGLTVGVSWDLKVLPYLWLWFNYGALDFPWWGRSHNLGMEPSSSITELGLKEYLDKGNALKVRQGEKVRLRLNYSVAEGSQPVQSVDTEGSLRHE
jgi:hypothetical protein